MDSMDSAAPSAVSGLTISLDTKSFSNICKRMGSHLQEVHQVKLTHTQVRTAMATALGFDSPNALDALLREQDAARKRRETPTTAAEFDELVAVGELDADQVERRKREQKLRSLLSGLISTDKTRTAVDLVNVSLSLLAQQYPPKLTAADISKIKKNYPSATDTLIAERAMAGAGVASAAALYAQAIRIAIDYFPQSDWSAASANDDLLGPDVGSELGRTLAKAVEVAVKKGMSPFGAATTIILTGSVIGLERGVAWSSLVRPLLDAIGLVMKGGPGEPPSEAEMEEMGIKMLMEQMGISRAEAKRYVAFAKRADRV